MRLLDRECIYTALRFFLAERVCRTLVDGRNKMLDRPVVLVQGTVRQIDHRLCHNPVRTLSVEGFVIKRTVFHLNRRPDSVRTTWVGGSILG